jgi:hypothetical protein
MDNLFAYTPRGGTYPEYLSLNDDGGKLRLTVRSPAEYPGGSVHAHAGPQGTVEIPPDQLKAMAWSMLQWLHSHGMLQDDPPLAFPDRPCMPTKPAVFA